MKEVKHRLQAQGMHVNSRHHGLAIARATQPHAPSDDGIFTLSTMFNVDHYEHSQQLGRGGLG